MNAPIHLIPKDGKKTADELLALRKKLGIAGTLHAADFYVEGSETWESVPGGWRREDGRIVNVDHHAPHPSMHRHVSSANLAIALIEGGSGPGPHDAIVISHIDCDSILSAGLLSGRLEPKSAYGEAAIAADHTGVDNEIADLLQALDAEWSRSKRGPPTLETVEYLFECLAAREAGAPLPDRWDGFAREAIRQRRVSRERAAEVAQEQMKEVSGVYFARLDDSDGPIEGELFLPHTPEAWLVATTSRHADHPERWRWKVRLGLAAPGWLSLHDLGIRDFDPVFGGRWNAGSNNRPFGTDERTRVPGSPLDPDDYHRRLVEALDARLLERAIEIAVDAHRGQRDKAGAPYILHPLRVMAACNSTRARTVGILHDLIEDTDWTLERLEAEGFPTDVVEGVASVTKLPEDKGPENNRYLAFCRRAAAHPLGREVKLADLADNINVSRLDEIDDAARKRLERYRLAVDVIRATPSSAAKPPKSGPWPTLVAHADWGSNPKKRWMCVAELTADGRYRVTAPEPVGQAPTLIKRLRERAGAGPTLAGFDFPIGIPSAYARRAEVTSFLDWLPGLGTGLWERFYDVAESADEISLTRPFYPMRPGGTKQSHLVEALSVDSMLDLLRQCDRKSESRGAASPIFWTLGGKQVGKAALLGWRTVLAPALAEEDADIAVWPFGGGLRDLIEKHRVVVVETYPAEACLHLGMTPPGRGWSKTSQEGRRKQAEALLHWSASRGVTFTTALSREIESGFGPSKDAEDPFDALLGLLSMLEVVMGHRSSGEPDDEYVRTVEGWILGQAAASAE